jgi:glycosyltransferase involved in cell wall biosynthesis
VARVNGRPVIAMLPAVRITQRAADLVLVQNPSTGRRLTTPAHMIRLSNAMAVELAHIALPESGSEERTTDIFFVGRLMPWKAPVLALRALRHVRHTAATLRFGDGPDQARLPSRDEMEPVAPRAVRGVDPASRALPLLSRAGVLVHPALHEEAGLCIAEALALGTPVVCLDHGGPAEIGGQWHGPSALITPVGAEATARMIASAIDRFLSNPPPVLHEVATAKTSYQETILDPYESAA